MSQNRLDDAPRFDDALSTASLRTKLSATTRTRIATLDIVDRIDSTNSELLRRQTSASGIDALFAEQQTGGRGRHGRLWASPPGSNLYLSLARRFDGGLARLGGLSLVVGIATADALHALGARAVRVKWPNDLVVDDGDSLRKIGGVLIEGGMQDGRSRAVIGLGLNVRMPEDTTDAIDQPWTDLHALLGDTLPSRTAIAAAVLASLVDAIDRFDIEGLAPFLARFDALDALRDADVTATIGGVAHAGVAVGLAEDGALRLRAATGEILLRAGEVSVRKRMPSQA
ncbi:MAG: biotin--[acetyl-CoA-carboxylase] ligase [Xanthomonadales bacterium]|nr:biotin--[acetyl-CoA-carboxylase] ligase [Xanthomonadales bacterium]